jgi:hypothetical protein
MSGSDSRRFNPPAPPSGPGNRRDETQLAFKGIQFPKKQADLGLKGIIFPKKQAELGSKGNYIPEKAGRFRFQRELNSPKSRPI